jgi:hypothetical protein
MNVQSEQAEEALSAEEVLSNAVNSYFTRSSSLQDHQNQSEAADEAELTNLLFYSRWPLDDPEETMRRLLTKGPRQVCQYQFKKNDIVWNASLVKKMKLVFCVTNVSKILKVNMKVMKFIFITAKLVAVATVGTKERGMPRGFVISMERVQVTQWKAYLTIYKKQDDMS